MSLAPALARALGRPGLARGESVVRTGQGAIYGRGAPAVGLRASAQLGSATAGVSFDTGTISVLMIGAIVVGLMLFYGWTNGSQA